MTSFFGEDEIKITWNPPKGLTRYFKSFYVNYTDAENTKFSTNLLVRLHTKITRKLVLSVGLDFSFFYRKTYLRYIVTGLEAGYTYTFEVYTVADDEGLVHSEVKELQQGTSKSFSRNFLSEQVWRFKYSII